MVPPSNAVVVLSKKAALLLVLIAAALTESIHAFLVVPLPRTAPVQPVFVSRRKSHDPPAARRASRTTTRVASSAWNKLPEMILLSAPSLWFSSGNQPNQRDAAARQVVTDCVTAWNARNATALVQLLGEDDSDEDAKDDGGGSSTAVVWNDYTAGYQPVTGRAAVERAWRLQLAAQQPPLEETTTLVVDQTVISSASTGSENEVVLIGLECHWEETNHVRGETAALPRSRLLAVMELKKQQSSNRYKIVRMEQCQEPAWPSGEGGLRVLSLASKFLDPQKPMDSDQQQQQQQQRFTDNQKQTPPERYFAAWNVRDMEAAAALFTEDAVYDDTAFPGLLEGKTTIQKHLDTCAECFPSSFQFRIDEIVGGGASSRNSNNKGANTASLLVRWHVENDGQPLPFTRGLSFYELEGDKIRRGLDIVDGQPIKTAPIQLFIKSLALKIQQEPVRLIPLATWFAYMYIVFFSNGILPGKDAFQLEQRTWEEVLNLSLNFFLVSPVLGLPFSPVVHPMLEGVFNWLLAWAALFAGFLSDDRRDKPNAMPMLPTVVGMQFLTSAFLLPYLATRSTEERANVVQDDLTSIAQITERWWLGPSLGVVGAYSMVWAMMGRYADFGGLSERWSSFRDLISIDRVGASFLVDLGIFALFQAWLIDDDLKSRGVASSERSTLRFLGKYVPFFGMAAYLALRPQFEPSVSSSKDE